MDIRNQMALECLNLLSVSINFSHLGSHFTGEFQPDELDYLNQKFKQFGDALEKCESLLPDLVSCPAMTVLLRTVASSGAVFEMCLSDNLSAHRELFIEHCDGLLKYCQAFDEHRLLSEIRDFDAEGQYVGLTPKEFRMALGVSQSTLNRRLKNGQIKTRADSTSKKLYVHKSELQNTD